jgi:hypothetical protein
MHRGQPRQAISFQSGYDDTGVGVEHDDQGLESKVRKWVLQTGFPLEMEAASAFRNAGFEVRQSGTFVDLESNKGREIDVVASDPDWIGIVNISFVIECKASPNPWVVLASQDALANFNRIFAFSILSPDALEACVSRIHGSFSTIKRYIMRPNQGGYGLRQAFGKGDDAAYTAAMSAIKGCHDLARKGSGDFPALTFAFPVIVVDAPLFECTRKDDGKIELSRVQASEFLFSAHVPEPVSTCVKVVHREHLPKFASEMKQLANAIRQEFKKEEETAIRRQV